MLLRARISSIWQPTGPRRSTVASWLALTLIALAISGCAGSRPLTKNSQLFEFQHDTFAFANELVWDYYFDADGKWSHKRHEPKPDYTHHCFVVARSAQQFFQHARFDPSLPRADEATYRKLIRDVRGRSLRNESNADERIVIPGYADLRSFSTEQAALLKAECGGAWQSYFQRGHWRVVWPFSRSRQESVARSLEELIAGNRSAVIHLVRFPQLTINHAVVVFGSQKSDQGIEFAIYDPNKPERPGKLTFDRASRTFLFPANDYFSGGRVDVYQIYHSWWY